MPEEAYVAHNEAHDIMPYVFAQRQHRLRLIKEKLVHSNGAPHTKYSSTMQLYFVAKRQAVKILYLPHAGSDTYKQTCESN